MASSNLVLAESERQVRLKQTEAMALSIERIADAIANNPHGQEAVQYLLAQKYLEMGQAIGQSGSSKVLFMDPQSIPGAIQSLLAMTDHKMPENMPENMSEKCQRRSLNSLMELVVIFLLRY